MHGDLISFDYKKRESYGSQCLGGACQGDNVVTAMVLDGGGTH